MFQIGIFSLHGGFEFVRIAVPYLYQCTHVQWFDMSKKKGQISQLISPMDKKTLSSRYISQMNQCFPNILSSSYFINGKVLKMIKTIKQCRLTTVIPRSTDHFARNRNNPNYKGFKIWHTSKILSQQHYKLIEVPVFNNTRFDKYMETLLSFFFLREFLKQSLFRAQIYCDVCPVKRGVNTESRRLVLR